MAARCIGRLTAEPKNIPVYKYEAPHEKFGFFLPRRCPASVSEEGEICGSCAAKEASIPANLAKWKGSMQNQSSQFHGRITEPLPAWSRIYGSPQVLANLKKGYTISEEVRAIAEAAVAELGYGSKSGEALPVDMAPRKKVVEPAEPTAVEAATAPAEPVPKPKATRKPKTKAAPTEPVPAPVPEPVSAPTQPVAATPAPKPPPKRRAPAKKVPAAVPAMTSAPTEIQGIVAAKPFDEEVAVVKVPVRKIEIEDRAYYLDGRKDKLYDMKFNYVGRYNRKEQTVETGYPDSDAETIPKARSSKTSLAQPS